jgi:hypothetical protein
LFTFTSVPFGNFGSGIADHFLLPDVGHRNRH